MPGFLLVKVCCYRPLQLLQANFDIMYQKILQALVALVEECKLNDSL